MDYSKEILRLKNEKNAIILAHYYQEKEVQEVADYLGDSLKLAQIAAQTQADIIVFCGVHFMAETAKILNPEKKVLLPVMKAGCKMADMISPAALSRYKEANPNTKIITYVNSTAEVKALSDCICTSSNALKIINHYLDAGEKILYCPDQNLGKYAMHLIGKQFEVWDGCCPIHHFLKKSQVLEMKKRYPQALIVVHPECQMDIINIADYVGSTKQLLDFTKTSSASEFIVCTEKGVIHAMEKESPAKKFYLASPILSCINMKYTHIKDVYECLLDEKNVIEVAEEVSLKARVALDKMLELSN